MNRKINLINSYYTLKIAILSPINTKKHTSINFMRYVFLMLITIKC